MRQDPPGAKVRWSEPAPGRAAASSPAETIDLLRTLTNPEIGRSIDRLSRVIAPPAAGATVDFPPINRSRHQLIERSCQTILLAAGQPMNFRAVHYEAESLLNEPVSYSSVKNAVIRLARKGDTGVIRIGAGIYWHD